MFNAGESTGPFGSNQQADQGRDFPDLSRLNAVRLIVISLIGIGYASTMPFGPETEEYLNLFGYDPSLMGLQVLFFLSGWLAWRSLASGKSATQMLLSRAQRTLPWVALYTLMVVAVLYPLLCNHDAPIVKGTADLALYFLKTVTLIEPGKPMPGALDNAVYACLLQGTVWTLRWGALAFLGLAILWRLGLKDRHIYLGVFILALVAKIGLSVLTEGDGHELAQTVMPGLRMGYAFLMGLAVGAFQIHSAKRWLILFTILMGATIVHYYLLPWSHAIEILATMSWCALAMTLIHAPLRVLQNWPNLVLPTYLGLWPLTQIILATQPEIDTVSLIIASVSGAIAVAALFVSGFTIAKRPVHRHIQAS